MGILNAMCLTETYHAAILTLDNGRKSLKETIKSFTDALEKKLIIQAIDETKGNKSAAARKLEIDYKTLHRKIKIHGIDNEAVFSLRTE